MLAVLFFWIIGGVSGGQSLFAETITRPLQQNEKIVVRGFKGRLQVIPSATDVVRADFQRQSGTGAQWRLEWVERSPVLELTVRSQNDSIDWERVQKRAEWPQFDIKLSVPAKKTEIFWGEGQVVIQNLKQDISVQMNEGDLSLTQHEGAAVVSLLKGRLKVAGTKGQLEIQSFQGQVQLENTQGAMTINNYSAAYRMENHQGPLQWINHSGNLVSKDLRGAVKIFNSSGMMSFKDLSGSIEGELKRGALSAQLKSVQTVSLTSDEAAIQLETPKESSALVSMRSEKGHLKAPPYFGKLQKGQWTELRGQLKGKEQGNIKIISKYGDIVLK